MKIFITTLFAWSVVLPAFAAQTNCPDHYADGQAPELVNACMRERAKELSVVNGILSLGQCPVKSQLGTKIISRFLHSPQACACGTPLRGKGLTETQKSEIWPSCREWLDVI